MQRYFFDLHEGGSICVDPEGMVLTDEAAARTFAVACARDVMGADVRKGRLLLDGFIAVRSCARSVFDVRFGDVVSVSGG